MMHWIPAHFIGDYVIQNGWMARGKKKSSFVCAVHVGTYMIPYLFCGLLWWQLALIAVQHFIQDRTHIVDWWMKFYCGEEFTNPPWTPWSPVVIDNIWHLLWVYFVVSLSV